MNHSISRARTLVQKERDKRARKMGIKLKRDEIKGKRIV